MPVEAKASTKQATNLEQEIAEFYKKSPSEIATMLADARLDPKPTEEAIMRLMKEKFGERAR